LPHPGRISNIACSASTYVNKYRINMVLVWN